VGESAGTWDDARRCVDAACAVAARRGVQTLLHATTNGQLTGEQAAWLAERFDAIDLSCDGPPEVQDAARPRRDGGRSSERLEEAARLWTRRGVAVTARATVTPATLPEMRRLVSYLAGLHLRCLRMEPVYACSELGFSPRQADGFVRAFLEAQRLGREWGVDVEISSPRLDELHGPFCEVARDALRLLPNGDAVMCLHGVSRVELAGGQDAILCRAPAASAPSAWQCKGDPARLAAIKARLLAVPAACQDCINQLHCSRTCPDECVTPDADPRGTFRCRYQQGLAMQWIWSAAWPTTDAEAATSSGSAARRQTASVRGRVEALLGPVWGRIDPEPILQDLTAAAEGYPIEDRRMPPPPWIEHGFERTGSAAWDALCEAARAEDARPASIYIHVPFCEQRCLFCDCHTMFLPRSSDPRKADYVAALLRDIDRWTRDTPSGRWPITTVHLGGGTPTCLGSARLERIVEAISRGFAVNAATEWAIETTEAGAEEAALAELRRLGFGRLHVGVQTPQEPLRTQLGRRVSSEQLLQRLSRAMRAGHVTSVDLIYGLPEQTLDGWLDTLEALVGCGVHGVSVYALNLSRRNRGLPRRFPSYRRDDWRDCLMLQLAEQLLTRHGYLKNHFVHYALPADRNLYFRHAVRGENLIALGPSASGRIGTLDYRCHEYPEYMACDGPGAAIEGTLQAGRAERAAQPFVAGLMAGSADPSLLPAGCAADLIDRWRRHHLLGPGGGDSPYLLTALGSWLIARMIGEVGE